MNAWAYWMGIGLGAVVSTALFALRLNKQGMRPALAAAALPVWTALAAVGAKVLYFLLLLGHDWLRYGMGGLFRLEIDALSFFGGCAGAVAGVYLAGKCFRQDARRWMDAFAPAGALMVCFARGCEFFLEGVNQPSAEVETAFFQRFPFAVKNEWDEWYAALFMLSAAFALIVCVVFLLRKKENAIPGLRMERVAFYLCLPQIFCESLRNDAIKWGFVRPEQVLCAVVILFLLIHACRLTKQGTWWKTYWPVVADVLCVIVMVGVEFNLDKTFLDVSATADYAVMWLALAVIAWGEMCCTRRRLQSAGAV